jgi:hypothetical protein
MEELPISLLVEEVGLQEVLLEMVEVVVVLAIEAAITTVEQEKHY